MPAGTYDKILAREEAMQIKDAEDERAQQQTARRAARQAEAAGVRARNEAYFAPLPGMTDDIIAARLRVEKHWLKRREDAMMRDVAAGSGILGIGAPPPMVRRPDGWPAPRATLKPPWTREPTVAGDPLRSPPARPARRAGLPAWLPALLAARRRRRRPRPELWRRAPGPAHVHAPVPEPGPPPGPAGDMASWADTRPMREFRRPPAAPYGEPADLDEPADFLSAPAPDHPDGLASYDHDGLARYGREEDDYPE